MGGIIFIFVLAVTLNAFANTMSKDSVQKKEVFFSTGTIQKVIYLDYGDAYYYVSFSANGTAYSGQSITYSSSTKTLNPGDVVKIQYYFTKLGRARVIIDDDRVISCQEKSLKGYIRAMKVVSFVLIGIALVLFIKQI